jgi:hypothetical protein
MITWAVTGICVLLAIPALLLTGWAINRINDRRPLFPEPTSGERPSLPWAKSLKPFPGDEHRGQATVFSKDPRGDLIAARVSWNPEPEPEPPGSVTDVISPSAGDTLTEITERAIGHDGDEEAWLASLFTDADALLVDAAAARAEADDEEWSL